VGRLQRVYEPAVDVVGGARRKIDELKVDVLERKHAGQRLVRGVWIRPDRRPRPDEPRVQRELPGVRRTEQRNLTCALVTYDVHRARAGRALPRTAELVGQLLDSTFDVRLEMLRTLVLGYRAQHRLQAGEALALVVRGSISLLGAFVLRG